MPVVNADDTWTAYLPSCTYRVRPGKDTDGNHALSAAEVLSDQTVTRKDDKATQLPSTP